MTTASNDLKALTPAAAKVTKPANRTAEQFRMALALKETARQTRQQLATQGLKLPTQGLKRATTHKPVK